MAAGIGKLLVVDANASSRDQFSQRLQRRGHDVEVAINGVEALEKINHAHYDLVLLDQMMPGSSGLDLLRLLRGAHSEAELPVIMVANGDGTEKIIESMREAFREGANDYVTKPVALSAIATQIEPHLKPPHTRRKCEFKDPLTSLGNRAFLMRCLREASARRQEVPVSPGLDALADHPSRVRPGRADGAPAVNAVPDEHLAIVVLDVDDFKLVNDRWGCAAGDHILVEIADRMGFALANMYPPAKGAFFRTGGDEFSVILDGVDSDERLDEVVLALTAAVARPIALGGASARLTACVGAARDIRPSTTARDLLQQAGLALRRAKSYGKSRVEIHLAALNTSANRRTMAADLAHALERGEMEAYYQPIMDLKSRSIVGFEALLRWRHSGRGSIQPVDFIPIAEETGLIIPIGSWILEQACRQLQHWQQMFPQTPILSMNVNLSVKQLKDPQLVGRIETILAATGLDPATLRLELTESTLITDVESAQHIFARLRALGVGLKLDDFGMGYSSFGYLRSLSFDALKIDRSFILSLNTDPGTRKIVESIMGLAGALNMGVVAEGIETESQRTELLDIGCRTGQGFLFSKPLPAAAVERLLRSAQAA